MKFSTLDPIIDQLTTVPVNDSSIYLSSINILIVSKATISNTLKPIMKYAEKVVREKRKNLSFQKNTMSIVNFVY